MEILCGARVMTMDAYQPEAGAVAIDGALIVAVGSESHVRAVAGAAPVTRLPGGVLLPGFIDAHHHYAYAALAGQTAPLRTRRGSSIKELLRRIAAEAGASPAGCVYLAGMSLGIFVSSAAHEPKSSTTLVRIGRCLCRRPTRTRAC